MLVTECDVEVNRHPKKLLLSVTERITIIQSACRLALCFPMSSVYFLILCSLLQADHAAAPRSPVSPGMPFSPVATQSSQAAATPPIVPPVVPSPTNQLHLRNGVLVLPIHNRAPMAAPQSAVLMSLRTEQRDTAGNILRDNEGRPIMVPLRQ